MMDLCCLIQMIEIILFMETGLRQEYSGFNMHLIKIMIFQCAIYIGLIYKNPKGRFGITAMDFADFDKCSRIISTNF